MRSWYRQWGTSTRGIEVAQKCSVSSGAKAEWFDDSILKSKLNNKISLPVLHYSRNIFAQPLSLASTYIIDFMFQTYQGEKNADKYHDTELQVCQHDQCEKQNAEEGEQHVANELNVNHFINCPIEVFLKIVCRWHIFVAELNHRFSFFLTLSVSEKL